MNMLNGQNAYSDMHCKGLENGYNKKNCATIKEGGSSCK